MKKVLSMVLSLILALSMVVTSFAVSFPDVDENYSWAKEAVEELSEKGVITGYDDGTFKPGRVITRQEAITLFSKAMGAGEEMNASFVDFAYRIYETELEGCEDSYAKKPGAYMIYRKILSSDEVKEYLTKDKRNLELKRYEAAILISKALGADSWLKANSGYDVEFSDKDEIPATALGYVYYASELGIIGDMGENKFGPNKTVTRAQIAVMIKRILDTMDFEYIHGMISSVDTVSNNLSIKTLDGETAVFKIDGSNVIYLDGEKVLLSALKVGMECVFTLSGESLYQIDAITYEGEEIVAGAFRGKTTTNTGTTIKLEDVYTDDGEISNYKLAPNAVIEVNGKTGSVNDISNGDYVIIAMSGGLGVSVSAEPKSTKVSSVKIQNIDTSDGVVITVLTKDDELADYILSDSATITRNGAKTTFSELAIGDSAELTLNYRRISNIMATGKEKNSEGTIEEITISNATSYITILTNGVKAKYTMSRDCKITLEGKEATVYDLRLGAYIKIKLSSEMVVGIESDAVPQSLSVTGTIKTINTSYGLVVIEDALTGADRQLFLKGNCKILNSATGKLITTKDLSVGQIITAAGTEKLGVYEVSSLMIIQ